MKRLLKLFVLLLTIFTINVYAEETNCTDDTNCAVTTGTSERKTTDERFYANEDVVVDEDITKSAFFAGNNVNISSKIDGIAFITGNSVIASTESDYAFIAGNSINLKNFHNKDAFIAGNQIVIENATARSIYAAGNSININTDYISDLYLAGNTVYLKGKFDNVVVDADKVVITGEITGKLKVNDTADVVLGSDYTKINETVTYTNKEISKQFETKNIFGVFLVTKLISFVTNFINLLIIGIILITLFKKNFDKASKIKNDAGYVFGRIGLGLCALIFVPIISIVLLITGFASLVGILLILAYIIALMVTTPVVAINYGNILFKNIKNDYLRFVICLIILQIVKLIPVFGGLVTFLSLCLGLGLIKDLFLIEKKEK